MNEMSIIHEIAETVSQYEEQLLYDVESHHHEYTLEYDEENNNMSLLLKESYYTEETKWVHNHTTIEKYNITPSMYANISIIILRDHLHITKNGCGMIGTKHILKVQPQAITPI